MLLNYKKINVPYHLGPSFPSYTSELLQDKDPFRLFSASKVRGIWVSHPKRRSIFLSILKVFGPFLFLLILILSSLFVSISKMINKSINDSKTLDNDRNSNDNKKDALTIAASHVNDNETHLNCKILILMMAKSTLSRI